MEQSSEIFVKCLKDASKCMLKKCSSSIKKGAAWFDSECLEKKKETRAKLNRYRGLHRKAMRLSDKDAAEVEEAIAESEEAREIFVNARKSYRALLKIKERDFKMKEINTLLSGSENSTDFWKQIRKMGCSKKKRTVNNISMEDWAKHFKHVFQSNEDFIQDNSVECEGNDDTEHFLNTGISEEEIIQAITKLKRGKAAGLDDISAEMLKLGGKRVHLYLTKLFNSIFDKGLYPSDWSKAIIVPIFKKGDPEKADNYRGVSLLSVISKCYTSILNQRLYTWLENEQKISENQAGFRKHYSTVDQIFTLHAAIQSCLCKRGKKLYVAFVDLKKAFDSVRRDKFIHRLNEHGVKCNFL